MNNPPQPNALTSLIERRRSVQASAKHKYTLKRDGPDPRDIKYSVPIRLLARTLPPRVDLRAQLDRVYDQGALGSCTANALALSFDFSRRHEKLPLVDPSRLFLYYNERAYENTVDEDAGAELRTGVKVCAKAGCCAEDMWPYDTEQFTVKPSDACYQAANNNLLKTYMRIDNTRLNLLKTCLADGYTFVCGIIIFDSFESDRVALTGIVPMPATNSEELLGGHAVTCVGYDDANRHFIMRNSWSDNWGDRGHFYIPYAYLTNAELAMDFWTLRTFVIGAPGSVDAAGSFVTSAPIPITPPPPVIKEEEQDQLLVDDSEEETRKK